jgi:phosphoglycolate phosphatase
MHVIFDLDGTLADTHPGIADAFHAALREILPDTPVPDFIHHIGPPVREVFRNALGLQDEALLDSLNAAFRHHYDGGCWKNSQPYRGIPGLLDYLRLQAIPCSVLTNKPSLPTSRILEHFDLRSHFVQVISPDSASPPFRNKPEAAAHLAALLQPDPATTWIIGDSADDAAAAAACGFHFAAAAYGYGQVHLQSRHPVHLTLPSAEHFLAHLQTTPHPL